MALSRFVTFSISLLRNLDIEAYKFYDRTHRFKMQHFLQGVILNMLFSLYRSEINHIMHLSKFNL